MTTTYTTRTAHDTLTAEGYDPADVDAALNSMVSAGFELPQPGTGDYILTSAELDVLRDQINTGAYVVVIEAANADETIWQAVTPAEVVRADPSDTAADVAEIVAANQNVLDPGAGRVRVWNGAKPAVADGGTPADAEHYVPAGA